MTELDSRGVSAAAKAPCPVCGKPIHALDGAVSSGGEPMRHTDCERAASIDYAAAFDILYQRALDNQQTVNALVEATTQSNGEPWEHDGLLVRLYADDSTSWSTYEACVLAVAGSPADEPPMASVTVGKHADGCPGPPRCYGCVVFDPPIPVPAAASPADERLREALRSAKTALRAHRLSWIALSDRLDTPYPDHPDLSPWSRFALPACQRGKLVEDEIAAVLALAGVSAPPASVAPTNGYEKRRQTT